MNNDPMKNMSGTFYGGLKQGRLVFRGHGGQTLTITPKYGARLPELPSPIEASNLRNKVRLLSIGVNAEYFERGGLFV